MDVLGSEGWRDTDRGCGPPYGVATGEALAEGLAEFAGDIHNDGGTPGRRSLGAANWSNPNCARERSSLAGSPKPPIPSGRLPSASGEAASLSDPALDRRPSPARPCVEYGETVMDDLRIREGACDVVIVDGYGYDALGWGGWLE